MPTPRSEHIATRTDRPTAAAHARSRTGVPPPRPCSDSEDERGGRGASLASSAGALDVDDGELDDGGVGDLDAVASFPYQLRAAQPQLLEALDDLYGGGQLLRVKVIDGTSNPTFKHRALSLPEIERIGEGVLAQLHAEQRAPAAVAATAARGGRAGGGGATAAAAAAEAALPPALAAPPPRPAEAIACPAIHPPHERLRSLLIPARTRARVASHVTRSSKRPFGCFCALHHATK